MLRLLSKKDKKDEDTPIYNVNAVLNWYFVQEPMQMINTTDLWYGGVVFLVALVLVTGWFFNVIFFSPWVMFIVAALMLMVFYLMYASKPHRQIYYNIDSYGIYCEFRSTDSRLMSALKFWKGVFTKKSTPYTRHSVRQKSLAWEDVTVIHTYEEIGKIEVSGGLKGNINVWFLPGQYIETLYFIKDRVDHVKKVAGKK